MGLFRKAKSSKEIGELIGRPITTIKNIVWKFKKKTKAIQNAHHSKLSQKDKRQILRKVLKIL